MKYLTIDDVCEMLSISRRTLERMRQKKLSFEFLNSSLTPLSFPEPDLHIGRSPRWEQEKLITWLQENGSRLES